MLVYTCSKLCLTHIVLCLGILVQNIQAQSTQQDNLPTSLTSNISFYYVKPVLGLHWSYSKYSGGLHFRNSHPHDRRNSLYGLAIGYHVGRFNLETGIIRFPVYTGFRFTTDDQTMIGSAVRVTYWQFPLTGQYILWQPGGHFQMSLLAGAAINTDLEENLLPSTSTVTFISGKSGGTISTIRLVKETNSKSTFLSTTLGIAVGYKLLKQIDLTLQVNRLFSHPAIVTQSTQLQQNSDLTLYQVNTQAGAAGLSALIGLSYRFQQVKRYKLNNEEAN